MKKYIVGADIGGSHIAAAIVDVETRQLLEHTKFDQKIEKDASEQEVFDLWCAALEQAIKAVDAPVAGIGLSIPGPFDYKQGIAKIHGVGKYESIYGCNVRLALFERLGQYLNSPQDIQFINDADGFILGESWKQGWDQERIIGVTLGTGYGSGFIVNGEIQSSGDDIPANGEMWCTPYKDSIAEDYVSTRWFTQYWFETTGEEVKGVKEIADQYDDSAKARALFSHFGENLQATLAPYIKSFGPDKLILGGRIVKAIDKFKDTFERSEEFTMPDYVCAVDTEHSAILGAVKNYLNSEEHSDDKYRNTAQNLLPVDQYNTETGTYNIYPSHPSQEGDVEVGYESLARAIAGHKAVRIDAYMGVQWDAFTSALQRELHAQGVKQVRFLSMEAALKPEEEINSMVEAYLGGDDPIFGKIYEGEINDFIDADKLALLQADPEVMTIAYGPGAALLPWADSALMYVDVPKNEIQFRSRAAKVCNLGMAAPIAPKPQYKRMYFVDWMVLNKHKAAILADIDYIVDEQRITEITWATGTTLRSTLDNMSENAFRVRPWFEPGAWGGQWIKDRIPGLAEDVPNYAWSFELIVPENGILLEGKGKLLEVSFDFLMFQDNKKVLGEAAARFGTEFPIRFDFLDTFDGGNLSVQCHPRTAYMKEHFGHEFTQDETYYMLDAEKDAKVYLGFQEGIDPKAFQADLENSFANTEELDIEKYVQVHPAKKHDLFLIPNGTIHCSGTNGMVLEISATPYIFTFKMYDWLRVDLDGKPRPMNIQRGMDNLHFEYQGNYVQEELISKQRVIAEGDDHQTVNLSTHQEQFFAVDRLEFDSEMTVELNEQCHILSLVEGSAITVETQQQSFEINYAETFVVPAAAGSYRIINKGDARAKVIKAFVKPEACK